MMRPHLLTKKLGNLMLYLLPMLLGVGGVFSLFFDQWLYVSSSHKENLVTVGHLTLESGDVRKRSKGDLVWKTIGRGEKIFSGDVLFLGESSAAEVTFLDQRLIKLRPGSLVVIEEKGVEVQKGSLESKMSDGQKLQVTVDKKSVDLKGEGEGSEVLVRVNGEEGTQSADLMVLSGEVGVQGQKEKLSKNEGLDVFSKETKKFGLTLLRPRANESVRVGDNGQVLFIWQGLGEIIEGAIDYELILARDPKFSDIIQRKKVSGERLELSGLVKNEQLFWQVHVFKEGQIVATSPIWNMFIENLGIPILTNPTEGQSFLKEKKNPGHVQFKWDYPHYSDYFQLQIARDKEFTQIVREQNVEANDYTWYKAPAGIYYWRLRARDTQSLDETQWTKGRNFIVTYPLARPHLLLPLHKDFVVTPFAKAKVEFVWNAPPSEVALTHEITVAKDQMFKEIVFKKALQTSVEKSRSFFKQRFIGFLEGEGNYYWKVSVSKHSAPFTQISETQVASFNLRIGDLLHPPLSLWSKQFDSGFGVHWSEVLGAKKYELEWQEKGKLHKVTLSQDLQYVLPVKPEKWRLRSIDEFQRAGPFSAWRGSRGVAQE
jgi:hypothetical protein